MKILENFYKTTVSKDWATGTGNRYVTTLPTPTSGWLVVSPNNSSLREIVEYTAIGTDGGGNYITISNRGVGGTTEQTHATKEPIRMNITAEYWDDIYTDPTFTGTVTVPTPTNDTDASTKKYIDDSITATVGSSVELTGDQTVSGVKTFNSSPIIPAPTTDLQPSTKKYTDDGLVNKVSKTGTEIIDGDKTFLQPVTVPSPALGSNAATKEFVLSQVYGPVYPGWNNLTISYDDEGRISKINDTDLLKTFTLTYNSSDDVISITDGTTVWTLEYNAEGDIIKITN